MCALSFIGRHKERTFRRTGEKSRGSPTGGEVEAQVGETKTKSSKEITESWVERERVGLIVGEGMLLTHHRFQVVLNR